MTRSLIAKKEELIDESGAQLLSVDPVSPVEGQLWINTTENKLKYHHMGVTEEIFDGYIEGSNSSQIINIAALDVNWNLGVVFRKSITGSTNFTFSNIEDGKSIYLISSGDSLAASTVNLPVGTKTLNSDTYSLLAGQTLVTQLTAINGVVYARNLFLGQVSNATVNVTPNVNNIDEGGTVTFTLNTTEVNDGSTLYWTTLQVSGNVNASDFQDGQLSGSVVINSNTAVVNRTLSNDVTSEGAESFALEIRVVSTVGPIVATSSSVTINDTSVAPFAMYFGGTTGPFFSANHANASPQARNTVTRLDENGTQFGSEANLGQARYGVSGCKLSSFGVYTAGNNTSAGVTNTVTRINPNNTLAGSETSAGSSLSFRSAAEAGGLAIVYGGLPSGLFAVATNTTSRIDSNGSLVSGETNVGSARVLMASATVGGNALFASGGNDTSFLGGVSVNTRINSSGSIVGSEVSSSTVKGTSGAGFGSIGIFFGSAFAQGDGTFGQVQTIDSNGATTGSTFTTGGDVGSGLAGARCGSLAGFYAGYRNSGFPFVINRFHRLNSSMGKVGSDTAVGQSRWGLAGAGSF